MKKFAIVSTWNGEGYSEENKLEMVIQVDSFETALRITNGLAHVEREEREGIETFNFIENGVSFTDEDDNSGSFQVFEITENSYGILIHPENNDADILTKEEFDAEFESALEQCDTSDYEEGDLFIHAYEEDLSYQFIRL
jgi:hypothetical protein